MWGPGPGRDAGGPREAGTGRFGLSVASRTPRLSRVVARAGGRGRRPSPGGGVVTLALAARPWQPPPLPPLRGARCGARSPSSPGGVWLGCCLTHTLASVRDRVSPSRSWVSARYFALVLRLMLLV